MPRIFKFEQTYRKFFAKVVSPLPDVIKYGGSVIFFLVMLDDTIFYAAIILAALWTNRQKAKEESMKSIEDTINIPIGIMLSGNELQDLKSLTEAYAQITNPQETEEAYVLVADKKGNTKAYQNYKAGMKNKVTGKPLYMAGKGVEEALDPVGKKTRILTMMVRRTAQISI